MAMNLGCLPIFFFILTTFAESASVSGDVFDFRGFTGRSLLQMVKDCPVNFESQNYTTITNQCTAPEYKPNLCCDSFKKFACPFADALNDLSNNCASIMFSYINLYGKYPPGLFANECREGRSGDLSCPENATETTISVSASPAFLFTASITPVLTSSSLFMFLIFP